MSASEKVFLPNFLLLALVSGTTIGMSKIVITLYALSLGAGSLEIGIISAMESLGMIFLTLPAGFIIARYGARLVYFLSSLGPMLVNLLIALYAVWWWLALSQLLIGLFIPFRIVAMNGVFLRHLPRIGVSKAGWYRGALTLGMGLLGPLLGNALSERGLYHAAFVLIASSFALMAFYSLRFWEGDDARSSDENADAGSMLAQTRSLLSNRSVVQSCLVELLNAATASLFTTFIILLALELKLPQAQAVSLVMFEALFVVIALFSLGRLLRKQTPAHGYLTSLLLAVASLGLCAIASGYAQLLVAALLLSLATAIIHLVNMARLSQRVEDKSKISGLFNLASMAGSFGGALLGGAISHFSGLADLFLWWIPLLLVSALLLSRQRSSTVEVSL